MIPLIQLALIIFMLRRVVARTSTRFYPRHQGSMSGVRRGNGVVKIGDMLWITQGDGSLRILSITDDKISEVALFEPTKMTNRDIECTSSVSLHEINGVVQYGVYSIIDVPTSDNDQTIVSRLIAVSPSGEQLRETIVAGIAVGTPQISADGNTYVVHNDFSPEIHGGYNFGKLSVVDDRFGLARPVDLNGASLFGVEGVEREAPFGPLSSTNRSPGDPDAKLYFGESWGNGEARFGLLYEFDGTHVTGLTRVGWSTVTPPTVSIDGKSMWHGGSGSSVHGWVKNRPFTSQPSWSINLGYGARAIESELLVTADNELLFVLTPHHQVFCLNATTGEKVWGNDGQVSAPTTMHISGNGSTLFTIGTDEGLVVQYDARTGRILSRISCHDVNNEEICTMPVEGALSVSYEGDEVYIGDVYGDVTVMNVDHVAYPLNPTSSPSASPSVDPAQSALPTSSPSLAPTITHSILTTIRASVFPTPFTSSEPPVAYMPVDAPVLITPTDTPVAPASASWPVLSPIHAIHSPTASPAHFPVLFPAMSPALLPVLSPVANTNAAPVAVVSATPSVVSTVHPVLSNIPTASLQPSGQQFDLNMLEASLDSFAAGAQSSTEQAPSKSVGSYFVAIVVVVLAMLAVGSVGILVGRVWQHRHERWHVLRTADDDAWFGRDDASKNFDTRLGQMD
jgi:hypothetical protein